MSILDWEPPKFDPMRQTEGPEPGRAAKRKMLAKVGGPETIRKDFQTNADGSVTMCHTRGSGTQPEFITDGTTANEVCSVYAEAGIVDLHGPVAAPPAGTLHYTDYVQAQLGTSAPIIGGGTLHPPGITGAPLADGDASKAFGADFLDKKEVAWHVPASLFTGRTKLYVQSLYGSTSSTLALTSIGGARPALGVSTKYLQSQGVPPFTIWTGCGVYLDPTDKTHWLISPGYTSVDIIKLKSSPCGEKLRKQLLSVVLTDEQKERIETYILAHAIPDPLTLQTLTYPATPDGGLGYSWKFNYKGDTCDVINVDEVIVRAGAYGFETTHFRLAFSRTGGVFSVIRSIVTGPSRWSVPKNINVIAYPDWENNKLLKAGNLPSGIDDAAQSGELYCFYAKDELKVISYGGSQMSHTANRNSSPAYFGGLYYSSPIGTHLNAFESGSTEGNDTWVGATHQFSCDGVTVGGENGTINRDETAGAWVGRTWGAVEATYQVSGSPLVRYTGVPALSGLTYNGAGTPSSYVTTWTTTETIPVPMYVNARTYRDGYTLTSRYFTETRGAFSLIVIPFMDAQAAYLSGQSLVRKNGTEHSGTRHGPVDTHYGSFQWQNNATLVWTKFFEKYDPVTLNSPGAAGGEPADTSAAFDTTATTLQPCKLICAAGTISASPVDVSPFYSALDSVEQSWGTLSSVNGVVYSATNGVLQGVTTFPLFSALIGWA